MATQETRLRAAFTYIGTELGKLRTLINGNVGTLNGLATTAKDNLVSAINELKGRVDGKQASLGFTPENAANKGAANGYAPLDANSRVPAANLPSYVDDVLEYAKLADFPAAGETGKLYVALDTNRVYRWSGSVYVRIVASPGSTDEVTEGTNNLYFTNARAQAAAKLIFGEPDVDYVGVIDAAYNGAGGLS